jgi:uncharacterized tellurite resistance protein B-like protein
MQHIVMGAIILVLGVAITGISLLISEETGGWILAYGAIVVGIAQLGYGLIQAGGYALKSPAEKAKMQEESETFAFIHCMIAMAAADGRVDDREINLVRVLFSKVMGMNVAEEDVRKVAEQYQKGARSWQEAIDFNARNMAAGRRLNLFRACAYVAAADGEIAALERDRIHQLAQRVGVREQDIEPILKEVLSDLAPQKA